MLSLVNMKRYCIYCLNHEKLLVRTINFSSYYVILIHYFFFPMWQQYASVDFPLVEKAILKICDTEGEKHYCAYSVDCTVRKQPDASKLFRFMRQASYWHWTELAPSLDLSRKILQESSL